MIALEVRLRDSMDDYFAAVAVAAVAGLITAWAGRDL